MGKQTKPHQSITPAITSLLIAMVTFVVLFALISYGITPEKYDIKLGEVSPISITASKDVEDTVTTNLLKDTAERAVSPSYNTDASVMPEVMAQLEQVFESINALPELRRGMNGELLPGASESMVKQGQDVLRALLPLDGEATELPPDVVRMLIEADAALLKSINREALRLAGETLNGKLVEGQEIEAVRKLKRDLMGERFPEALSGAASAVVGQYIRPNMLLDVETTEENREKARDDVDRVIFKKGQNIVYKGEPVTAPQYAMLESLGVLVDRGMDTSLYMGIALLLLLLCMVIGLYMYTFERDIATDPIKLALLCLISVVVAGLSLMIRPLSTYLMPVTLGAMLTSLLLKARLAIITNLVLAVLTGLLASVNSASMLTELLASADSGMFTSTMVSIIIASLISGPICVAIIRSRRQRISVLMAGLAASAVNALATVAVSMINSADMQSILSWAGYAAFSGMLSAVLCLGLQPLLEWMFNLDTYAKLTDLANPNRPLLKRLMIEAPGTYHHSMIVANLSEAAANAVGANGLLARVGAYYHDIGKLKRPLYFKENQMHDNPHDRTDPRVSTAILTAHTRDGVEMGQKARLPQALLEIIMQHHGDTPVLYFYDKAVKQGGDVDIADFRYDGPRPQKPEAAIVMLADTIEAAARAMTDSSPDKLSQLIQRLVRSKLEDGQLDRCSLTFRDLNVICEAFLTVLGGVYHERIEYPSVSIPERNRLEEAPIEAAKENKPVPAAPAQPASEEVVPEPPEQTAEVLRKEPEADQDQETKDES